MQAVLARAEARFHLGAIMKKQEIYEFSHEVKAPYTSIKGFASLLYQGEFGKLSGEQRKYLKTIMDEADRGMLSIQRMLDTVKPAIEDEARERP